MSDAVRSHIVEAARDAAAAGGREIADVSLDEIARRAGISRATLYRRIGSRRALDDAVRAAGFDPGGRPDVRERATAAAADLIEEGGLGALTLEAVAARADCSVPALYSQLGGREGLLAAVFDRYSPPPRIAQLFAEDPPELEDGVRRVYEIVFDAVEERRTLLIALIADAATRPDGPTARFLLSEYLPRVLGALRGWLTDQVAAGRVRPLPLPLLIQLLVAPIVMHALSRPMVRRLLGPDMPPREEVIESLTQAYLRAVAIPPSEVQSAKQPSSPDV